MIVLGICIKSVESLDAWLIYAAASTVADDGLRGSEPNWETKYTDRVSIRHLRMTAQTNGVGPHPPVLNIKPSHA